MERGKNKQEESWVTYREILEQGDWSLVEIVPGRPISPLSPPPSLSPVPSLSPPLPPLKEEPIEAESTITPLFSYDLEEDISEGSVTRLGNMAILVDSSVPRFSLQPSSGSSRRPTAFSKGHLFGAPSTLSQSPSQSQYPSVPSLSQLSSLSQGSSSRSMYGITATTAPGSSSGMALSRRRRIHDGE